MDWFELSYVFLGGLGIFFFGMKTLSDALQSLAGTLIRQVINALTTNRILAVGVGALVTAIVQSSSVTTVMVVGFVNAGFMELTQAIGVILGANIGTTVTGWIIAIKVGKYGLLFVALGMGPLMFFGGNPKVKAVGRLLLALGLIFLGLQFMSSAFKPLRSSDDFLHLMQIFSANSYLSLLACIAVGACLTFVIQSSSAMLGITMALASSGAIPFVTAAGLVLGENIGTTITALLASIGMNRRARQAAYAHAAFNVFGVLWISSIFWMYTDLVDSVIFGNPDFVAADGTKPYVAAHIAAGHTIFNVVNVLVFIPLIHYLAKFVTRLTPARDGDETPHLEFIPGMSPALAISAAQKQILVLAEVVQKMMGLTREYISSETPRHKEQRQIEHYEDVTDNIQAEITHFVSRVQAKRTSEELSVLGFGYVRAADELESIGDYCTSLVRYRNRLNERKESLSEEAMADLEGYFSAVVDMFNDIMETLEKKEELNVNAYLGRVSDFVVHANQIRDRHLGRVESGSCSPSAGMVFSDMIVALRKIRSHAINLVEALGGAKTTHDFDDQHILMKSEPSVKEGSATS